MFGMEPWALALALAVTGFAGFVKGAVGFAMPMIMMSAFGSFLSAETALALLILPTVVTNIAQAFRQGWRAAWDSVQKYRLHIAMLVIFIPISAQFVRFIPQGWMYGLLGVPIVGFAALQLAGRSLAISIRHQRRAEAGLGIIGGLYGGISGIWGPPLLVYLLSTGAGKEETVRVQGVVFLISAVMLLGAHLASGVLNALTLPVSALMMVPAMVGMWLGFRLQDRLNPARFRRWTLVLLALTGLNLLRRALGA
ncbi:sulfite exporter TauE/SafE family protein [Phaeovulum sp.]|uniref:sulfite exporter TauE/SafE family protein n=1 Tax=Phaeovulum sp. TaxID=2934796 RepID=UPI0027314F97|nr:sulfite exporter TauE/SafE family protein [Phaeovulum sp.]MDP1669350.1 sulfite exporter TauE/SafE family protein [Phaeovulum sp.]MDZ4119626.1 sulfite exporter TauE/SafE family protein [Phaeovulum sp.]